MKVIISENQLDKMKSKLSTLIEKEGLEGAAKMLGVSEIKLLSMIDYDISGMKLYDLFPILVDIQKEYEGCEIWVDWYEDNKYGVYWVYKEQIGNYEINCVTMAFPEFAIGKTYVENAHCWVDNNLEISDFNNKINYDVKTIDFDIPTEFNSWDDMVKWYKTEYMPNTYEIIEKQAFEIIKQLKKKNEI
jgi:hypothetical protein